MTHKNGGKAVIHWIRQMRKIGALDRIARLSALCDQPKKGNIR